MEPVLKADMDSLPDDPTPLPLPASLRVVLELTNGQFAGRKVWLRAGQVYSIGRTEKSDLALPYDKNMSGLHFSLECSAHSCKIRDCQSANGTQVNGQPITETYLRNADVITAGASRFLVTVEGAQAATKADGSPLRMSGSLARKPQPVPPPSKLPPFYKLTECMSEMALFSGSAPDPTPMQIAHLLTKYSAGYFIVDFNVLALEVPKELEKPEYLFNWLPEESIAELSPIVLTKDSPVDRYKIMETAWGNNAFVAFFSSREQSKVLEHLRGIIQGKKSETGRVPRNSLVGLCWPAVLRTLLQHSLPGANDYLFSQLDLALMEGDEPEEWRLFAKLGAEVKLKKIGFARLQEEEAQPDEKGVV